MEQAPFQEEQDCSLLGGYRGGYLQHPPRDGSRTGVKPVYQDRRRLADGSIIAVNMVNVVVQIDDRKTLELATVMGEECLLGLNALERLGFWVDPVERRLLPVPPARL